MLMFYEKLDGEIDEQAGGARDMRLEA